MVALFLWHRLIVLLTVADFARVNADAYGTYGMPPEVFEDLFDRPARLLADPDTTIVVAYQGSRPVATALTFSAAVWRPSSGWAPSPRSAT